ncbi:MAG: S-layer homology domain-containing protein [Oscillospiraceae bacterium]|jgi:hypothetical protein|nr:S-layer homology domain-containing protein [Oscillospiraceae bacterium]
MIYTSDEGIVLDNLSIQYNSFAAACLMKGSTIQNCEMAFIGGAVLNYYHPDEGQIGTGTVRDLVLVDDGNALIFGHLGNTTIINNYFHDIVNGPYNFEHGLNGTYENINVRGNLFERTGYGSNLTNFFRNDDPNIVRYRNVTIDDNYWLYNGYFTDRALMGYSYPMHFFEFFHPQQYVNINYTNNVFYLSKGTMFQVNSPATLDVINFSGNTYVQTNGGIIFRDDFPWEERSPIRIYYDENAEETIKRLTGDKTAIVLPLSFPPTEVSSPPNLATADSWAHDHIQQAYSKGFLPATLQNNYKADITRGEFVTLAMSWLRYKTNMTNAELLAKHAKPENMDRTFADTADADILAAARLDITAGTGGGQFGVNTNFNREQAAIMLMKICGIVGTFKEDTSDFGFTDIDAAQWLPDALNYVGHNEVMSGKLGGRFAPKDNFQRQESIIVFNKMG